MTEVATEVGARFPVEELEARSGAVLRGSPLVVYFYPQAGTPGCTIEAQRFSELYDSFREAGAEVIGVSVDPAQDNERFANDCGLQFPLVSDTGGELTTRLGLMKDYGEHGTMAARVTFLVDGSGVVRQIWPVTDVQTHAADALQAVRELA